MSAGMHGFPAAVVEQAVEWGMRLEEGELSAEESSRFERWMQADPRHAAAMEQLVRASHYFDLPAEIGVEAKALARELSKAMDRRRTLRNLVVAAGVMGGSGWLVARGLRDPYASDALRTQTGHREVFPLADGVNLQLNARSSAGYLRSAGESRIDLHAGTLLLQAPAASRQLCRVVTPGGEVEGTGAAFQVRLLAAATEVVVTRADVRIRSRSGATGQLGAGEKTSFTATGIAGAVAASGSETAWTDGFYEGFDAPLGEAVDALRAYRRGLIQIDATAAALRFSGVLPLDDTDRALHALAAALPLDIRSFTPYWVRISARA